MDTLMSLNMTKVSDWLVQDKEEHDDCLHRPLFPVNIRLLNGGDGNNGQYRFLIQHSTDIMLMAMEKEYSDYNELKGISGANVGIPFNIVIVLTGRNKEKDPQYEVLLNPVIVKRSRKKRVVESNCGSLNMDKPIDVERREWVDVEYYEFNPQHMKVEKKKKRFTSGTIQHEIDHNNGILITNPSRLEEGNVIPKEPSGDIK